MSITSNLYKRLQALLPSEPTCTGTVIDDHGDGTATVQMRSGGHARVRNALQLTGVVFIRGGEVIGEAPQLTEHLIEI